MAGTTCTGTVYVVSGRRFCVGEKKISKLNSKLKTKSRKSTKKQKSVTKSRKLQFKRNKQK